MAFINPKEELLKILLTQQGKKALFDGQFAIKYYSFFDDEVDYQSQISLLPGTILPPVNLTAPVASGAVTTAAALSVTNGTWANNPTSYSYQWRNDGAIILNATASTFTPSIPNLTASLTCDVIAINAAASVSASSNVRSLRQDILTASSAYAWWSMDSDRVTTAAGPVIASASDLVANRTLTFPVGHRPTYNTTDQQKPSAVFAGNEAGKDAGGLLNGLDAMTCITVWKQDNYTADYAIFLCYEADGGAAPQNGRWALYTYITSQQIAHYNQGPSLNANEMLSNAALDTTNYHVLVARTKHSDGVASAKAVRQDGIDIASANSVAQDSTGQTFGNYPVIVGGADTTFLGSFPYPAHGKLVDLIFCPYLNNADSDTVQQLLKALRGTP